MDYILKEVASINPLVKEEYDTKRRQPFRHHQIKISQEIVVDKLLLLKTRQKSLAKLFHDEKKELNKELHALGLSYLSSDC